MSPSENNSPWQILGLDETTASEQEIKRAYAKLLRMHRPDVDPEGFQRIQAAYKTAMHLVGNRNGTGEVSHLELPLVSAPNKPADEVEPVDVLPPEFAEAKSRLEKAVAEKQGSELKEALDLFRPIIRENEAARNAWGQLLDQTFNADVETLASLLPSAGVIRLLEAGQSPLAERIMAVWHEQGRTDQLSQMAASLLKRTSGFPHLEQTLTCARLGILLAFRRPTLAEQLANSVFPQLPPGRDRDFVMAQIENRLSIGKVFGNLGPVPIQFWEKQLCESGDPSQLDWDTDEARKALHQLAMNASPDWPGFAILHRILPKFYWDRLERGVNSRLQEDARQSQHRHHRRSETNTSRIGCGVFWIILIVIKVVVALFTSR